MVLTLATGRIAYKTTQSRSNSRRSSRNRSCQGPGLRVERFACRVPQTMPRLLRIFSGILPRENSQEEVHQEPALAEQVDANRQGPGPRSEHSFPDSREPRAWKRRVKESGPAAAS